MNRTLHFNFPLYENNDVPSILNDYNTTISEIDRVLYALSIASGSSEEYEHELERLQEEIDELTTVTHENGENIAEMSQTIATILGSVAALSTKVDGYDDRINTINTRLNNAYIAIAKKFDTRAENDLPSQPIYDSENNVYYIKVPYLPTTPQDTVVPQDIIPYAMNSAGFIWYGWRIIEFRVYKDNDESGELLSTLQLSPNDMVRPSFQKSMTYTYDEETETEVELYYWTIYFAPIISVQTAIDNSTYYKVTSPYNGILSLSSVVKGRTGNVKTVWFTNPCTIYWRDSQNNTVEVQVEPYKLYTALQGYQNNGSFLQAVYSGGSSASVLKRLEGYGDYDFIPVEYTSDGQEISSHKAVSISTTVTLGAQGSKGLTIFNNYPIIGSFTIRDIIENPSLSEPWTYDNTKDRLCITNNGIHFSLSAVTTDVLGMMQAGYYKDRPELTLYARYALPDIGTLPVPLCKVQIWADESGILLYPTENLADAASTLYNQYRMFPLPMDIDAQIELSLQLTDIKAICGSIDSTALGDFTITGTWYIGLARFN